MYLNIPHVLKAAWASQTLLTAHIPATGDYLTNRFFSDGVEHLSIEEMRELGCSYVVLNDLGADKRSRASHNKHSYRCRYRMLIYGDSETLCQNLALIYFGTHNEVGVLKTFIGSGVVTQMCRIAGYDSASHVLGRTTEGWYWRAGLEFIATRAG